MNATTTQLDALQPYSEVKAAVAKLKEENALVTFHYDTPAGNKLARSHIFSLRQRKGDVERVRKETKADALEYGRKVDAIAKELTGEIDSMIAVHQGPIDAIEQAEEARKQGHLKRLEELQMPLDVIADAKSCARILDRIKAVVIDDTWEEFKTDALELRVSTVRALEKQLAVLTQREAEQAELARLCAESEKRDAADRARREAEERTKRDEEIRAQAADKAKREAEAASEYERKKAEAAAQKALEAEREKSRKFELATAKAKQEKAEAEARFAREAQAKKDAEEKRKADTKHRKRIYVEVGDDVCKAAGITPEQAAAIVEAIIEGRVRHTTINF